MARVRSIPAKFDEALLRRAITAERQAAARPRPSGEPPSRFRPRRRLNPARIATFDDRSARRPRRWANRHVPSPAIGSSSSGRVLDPDGQPLAGAAVYFIRPAARIWVPHPRPPRRPEPTAKSGPDGRFEIPVDRGQWDDVRSIPDRFGPQVRTFPLIAAVAPRYGPSWVLLPKPEARADVTLQLVKDEVPIEGRILDLEGRPVPGATVTTEEILATRGEDLTPVIKSDMLSDLPGEWKCLASSIAGLPRTLTIRP